MSENFTHPYILITSYNKKFSKITMNKSMVEEDDYDTWRDFLDDVLEYSKEHRCWVLNNSELEDFIYMVKNANKKKERRSHSSDNDESYSEESSESSSSSDSSSSEDSDIDEETIQKALARRLKSESKQLEIDSHNVSDSEMEDVISTVRRLRHLYRIIDKLTLRVEELEAAILPTSKSQHVNESKEQ